MNYKALGKSIGVAVVVLSIITAGFMLVSNGFSYVYETYGFEVLEYIMVVAWVVVSGTWITISHYRKSTKNE